MFNQSGSQFVNVSIPAVLFEKLKEKVKETEFSSAESYLVYILDELLSEEDNGLEFSEEDEMEVKSRLRDLGYID